MENDVRRANLRHSATSYKHYKRGFTTMKSTLKKISAVLIIVFILAVQVVPVFASYYPTSEWVANWGQREVDCTSLSSAAQSFYTSGNDFATVSQLAGGTGTGNAYNSALYTKLKSIMVNAHDKITAYKETNNMYRYTDCQNGNTSYISSFYSGTQLNGTWDSAATWNKEHTWPNSKGLGGSDENDIIMLRPTSVSENSSRGNTAYGQSSGYYNPNSEGNGTYDLRGDVARICLYVYTRWGNTSKMWGSSGVMESLDVLLSWMEADPVDTWEMGRNDSVQSITGTRNVFVDYPEYAWLLFGKSVPATYTSPSNNAGTTPGTGTGGGTTGGGTTPPTTPTLEYVQPAVGNEYKFVLVNTLVSDAPYYATGTMAAEPAQYYADTTTTESAGAVFGLESASGGYYLFAMVSGAKKYVNMVTSGTHVNIEFSTTASTVYTYNSNIKTLVSTVGGTSYAFGTRTDKNYTTFGPSKVSDSPFVCKFVLVGQGSGSGSGSGGTTGGGTTGGGTTGGGTTTAPSTTHTIVEALAAADDTNVVVAGTVTKIEEEWTTQYNNMSVYISDGNGNELLIHRMATQVSLGDYIVVSGKMITYTPSDGGDSIKEIAKGATAVVTTAPGTGTGGGSGSGGGTTNPPASCTHTNTTVVDAVAADCQNAGYTGDTKCSDCGATVEIGTEVLAGEHNYQPVGADGKYLMCTGCNNIVTNTSQNPNSGKTTAIVVGSVSGGGAVVIAVIAIIIVRRRII